MTLNDFKILAKGLKAVYTDTWFLPDSDSIKIWYNLLKDLSYDVTNAAIQKYILTNKKNPTIADIRETASALMQSNVYDWSASWEHVIKAIGKYGMYNIDEAMASFDDITKRCVERLGFKNICMSDNIGVDRANFRMIYEQLATRAKQDSQIPIDLKRLIDNINQEQLKINDKEV